MIETNDRNKNFGYAKSQSADKITVIAKSHNNSAIHTQPDCICLDYIRLKVSR